MTQDYNSEAIALADHYAVKIPISDQPRYFLSKVWQAMPQSSTVGLSIEVDYLNSHLTPPAYTSTMHQEWLYADGLATFDFEDIHRQNRASYHVNGAGGIYWQISSRDPVVRRRYEARGSLKELRFATSFGADLDIAKAGLSLSESVLHVLALLPLQPSFIVFSGGGLQVIYALSEPFGLVMDGAIEEYKARVSSLFSPIKNIASDSSVFEAARILRLPGFVNRKPDRAGAIARIIYDSGCAYSLDEIRNVAPLPVLPILSRPKPPINLNLPAHTYQVGQDFVEYLITNQEQVPPERHPLIMSLARQAYRAGIPQALFADVIAPFAKRWLKERPDRAQKEPSDVLNWVYSHPPINEYQPGNYLVKWNTDSLEFELAPEDEQELVRSHIVIPVDPIPEREAPKSLEVIREETVQILHEYYTGKLPKGIATYLLIATPPGAGKTYALLKELESLARDDWQKYKDSVGEDGAAEYHGKVAYACMFNEGNADKLIEHFHLDPSLIFFLESRNKDNCQNYEVANAVAAKGHSIKRTLCKVSCKFRVQCELSGYLSQEKQARSAPMVLYRHQHMAIDELIQGRKFIGIDETPLHLLTSCRNLALADMSLPARAYQYDSQFAEEIDLLDTFCKALQAAISMNNIRLSGEYLTDKHVKLHGYWLISNLIIKLGSVAALQKIFELDTKLIHALSTDQLTNDDLNAVSALAVKWLWDCWSILKYEFETYYLARATRWNSRLIPVEHSLRIYNMQGLQFTRDARVTINDGTPFLDDSGHPVQYDLALMDKQGHKRIPHVYSARLPAKSHVTVFTGSMNSRKSFRRKKKED